MKTLKVLFSFIQDRESMPVYKLVKLFSDQEEFNIDELNTNYKFDSKEEFILFIDELLREKGLEKAMILSSDDFNIAIEGISGRSELLQVFENYGQEIKIDPESEVRGAKSILRRFF